MIYRYTYPDPMSDTGSVVIIVECSTITKALDLIHHEILKAQRKLSHSIEHIKAVKGPVLYSNLEKKHESK